MILNFLFISAYFQQPFVEKSVLYLEELLEVNVDHHNLETRRRLIWIGKNKVRTDREDDGTTMIYDLNLHTFYLLDHQKKVFYRTLSGREPKLARPPLLGLASLRNNLLSRTKKLVFATGSEKQISGWPCKEFQLNYPAQYGIHTRVWVAPKSPAIVKDDFKRLWFAAIGTNPPIDVKFIINSMLKEIDGIPIRIESIAIQEEATITTRSTILTIERRNDIDSQHFAVPPNYRLGDPNLIDQPSNMP